MSTALVRRYFLSARNTAGTEPCAPVVSWGIFNNRKIPRTAQPASRVYHPHYCLTLALNALRRLAAF
jgi:hypothetical protein